MAKSILLGLIFSCSLGHGLNCGAQVQYGSDPGESGVVDGSDVYQFLTSGPIIDPVRMEEASRKFDQTIKLPPRTKQARSWGEEIARERTGETGSAFNNRYIDHSRTSVNSMPAVQNHASSGGDEQAQANNSFQQSYNSAIEHHNKANHGLFGKMGMTFLRACDAVGFPVSDEFLPGDVDASLAGDLPPGEDPRVYVHKQYAKSAYELDQQPPTIIVEPEEVARYAPGNKATR